MPLISKSKYLKGLQCPRLIWFFFNKPEVIPDYDESTKRRFEEGRKLETHAHKLFPNAKLVEYKENDFMAPIYRTTHLLNENVSILEATFKNDDLYCRVDVLEHVKNDEYNLIEIKSSTRVKDVHVEDVAFQKFVLEKEGVNISKCKVMHVNNEYVKNGEIEPDKLFKIQDVTDEVEAKQEEVQDNVDEIRKVIKEDNPPEVPIGPQEKKPYDCPLGDECCSKLPDHNVKDLFYIGKKAYELTEEGIFRIKNIPDDYKLTAKQEIQKEAVRNEEPVVNEDKIRNFIKELNYPLHFFDFETFQSAIPILDGTRPYEYIPFQFSLHTVKEDGTTKHEEYLYKGKDDPRPGLVKALKKIGREGDVIAYNSSFEKRMLEGLAEQFPEEEDWINNIIKRLVDLAVPFRNFWHYDPEQRGGYSLKVVLPCLVGETYDNMDVQDGETAYHEYLRVNYGDADDEDEVRKALLEYCKQDTQSMIDILEELKRIASIPKG